MKDSKDATIESLGDERYNSLPSLGNRIAGVILILIFLGLAVGMFGFGVKTLFVDANVKDRIGRGLLGVGVGMFFGGLGVHLIFYMRRLLGFSLTICEHGFYVSNWGDKTVMPWQDIAYVQEWVDRSKLPIGLAAEVIKIEGRSYTVYRKDQVSVKFDSNNMKDPQELIDRLRRAAYTFGFKWNVVEIK